MNEEAYLLKMILDESGFTTGLNKATRKLNDFDGSVSNTSSKGGSKMGSIWTSFVGNFAASGAMKVVSAVTGGIADLGRELSDGSATWKTFNGNMENLGKGKEEIAAVKKELQDFATQTIYSASDMATTYSQLEAVGIKSSDQLVKAFGGLASAAENPSQAMTTLSQQATQMAAKPMVQWQDFKLMLEQTPAGVAAVAKTMGMSTAELVKNVQDGTIKTQDFFDAVTATGTNETFSKMATEYKTVGQAMDGLKETLVGKLQPAYDRVTKVAIDGIEKVVDWVSKIDFDAVIEDVKNVLGVLKTLAPVISGIIGVMVAVKTLNVFTTIVSGVQKAITVVKGLKTAFGVLKFAIAAAGGPVTIIIAAIGALVGVVAYLWTTNEDFRDAVIGIWNGIKNAFSDAWKSIKNAWGEAKGWFGDIWSSIKETASNTVKSVKNAWNGIGQWFSDTWQGIKDGTTGLFDKTVENSTNAVKSVKDAWSNTKQWFSDTWKNIKNSATKKWNEIKSSIMSVAGPLITGLINAFLHVTVYLEDLWNNLVDIGKNVFEILKNVILAPVLFITSMISGGWEETKNNMIGVWNNIKESATNIWESIKNIFVSYITNIYFAALNIWTGFKLTLANVWNEVVYQAKMVWTKIKYFFINLWVDIKYFAIQSWIDIKYGVIQTWIDLKYGAIDTWENIKQFFKDTWQNIKDTAYNTWISIKNTMIDTWNSIKNTFWNIVTGIVNSAENAWTNLKNGVSEAIEKVKNTFDDLKDINLLDVGKNIIDGLLDGINAKWENLKSKVKDIAGTITNGLKDFLNIHSPSRLMRDLIGKNVVLGIVEGIDQTSPEIKKTIEKLPFEEPDLPTYNLKRTITADQQASVTQKENNVKISKSNPEIHLHLNVYGDLPDSLIRQIAKKMKTELTKQMKRDADAVGGTLYAD